MTKKKNESLQRKTRACKEVKKFLNTYDTSILLHVL